MWLVLLAMVACSTHGPEEAARLSSLPSRPARAERVEAAAQDQYQAAHSLLLARHVEDLPSAEVLDGVGGDAALRWLAGNADELRVRERALVKLALYPDPDNEAFCIDIAKRSEQAMLQASALRCLAGQGIDSSAELQALALDAIHSDDVRVGMAAVDLLLPVFDAREGLRSASVDATLLPSVKVYLQEVLATPSAD